MKKIYEGKTKSVFQLEDGNIRLVFKDDVTGTDGKFDPGANTVGLSIKDNGYYGLAMSEYFFRIFEEKGIKTHYISSNLENNTMDVLPVTFLGQGIEVICRYKAVGSFLRRYAQYAKEGDILDAFVEISLKDDERGDPFISKELLLHFGILKDGEYDELVRLTKKTSEVIRLELAQIGLELIDLKLEFGQDSTGKIILIDEVSGGNMRVYKDGKSVSPIDISKALIEK